MSINTLQRAKKELIKRKVLKVHKRKGGSNYYELITPNPTQFLHRDSTQILIGYPTQKLRNIWINLIITIIIIGLKIREEVNKLKNKFSSFKKL